MYVINYETILTGCKLSIYIHRFFSNEHQLIKKKKEHRKYV